MSFSIIDQTATLNHINVRSEKHGGENVGGADLRISFTESAGILAEFHPSMRSHFYVADEEQGQLEGVEALTKRRFGDLVERLALKHEVRGAVVTIGYGIGGARSDIELETVDVGAFKVELLEGGSVNVSFKIKSNPDSKQLGKLYELLGNEITVTVRPAVDPQGNLLGD